MLINNAINRLENIESSPKNLAKHATIEIKKNPKEIFLRKQNRLENLILYSGISVNVKVVIILCSILGIIAFLALFQLAPIWLAIIVSFLIGFYPIAYLDKAARRRALIFALDFPNILLATSSSLSAGHTPLVSIELSTKLLTEDNMVRKEVTLLLDRLRRGIPKEIAVKNFAADINLPEIELFRSAFLLSLDSGGKLSITLGRLAQVLKDRLILISSASTATAVMRMTSSILLLLTPLIVGMVAIRTPNFFYLLISHPIASQLGSIGIFLIIFNCLLLRRMSDFRP